jgi:predicted nucleic acid-binding protein
MKIYLDNCSLQRPLDSRTSTRIILEAEAVLSVLALVESGGIELIASEILLFEIRRRPSDARRDYALEVLSRARTFVPLNERVEKRAAKFVAVGVKPLDALHLAAAEEAQADLFCTCDDRLLQKAKAMTGLRI